MNPIIQTGDDIMAKAEQKDNGTSKEAATVKNGKPSTTSKSEMLRVGIGFAEWAREEAGNQGLTLAQFTDTLPDIFETLID
jgi:phage repressor protein C with HTH and peptisase S24 domain